MAWVILESKELGEAIVSGYFSRMAKPKSKTKKKTFALTASTADRHELYQLSVQDAAGECDFFQLAYKDAFKKAPVKLREDFCGTFNVCCEWVRRHARRSAVGVDIDPDPISWGIAHNLAKLSDTQRNRVELIQADVRDVTGPKADVVAAGNFSFNVFHDRADLRDYFRAAWHNLGKRGIFCLDMLGGYEIQQDEQEEVKKKKGFKYVWEQEIWDPIRNRAVFHISFRFKDGSELPRAFTYDWRMWSIPEVREVMAEAGFSDTIIYWEGTDHESGEGDGEYKPCQEGEADAVWLAVAVGVKQ